MPHPHTFDELHHVGIRPPYSANLTKVIIASFIYHGMRVDNFDVVKEALASRNFTLVAKKVKNLAVLGKEAAGNGFAMNNGPLGQSHTMGGCPGSHPSTSSSSPPTPMRGAETRAESDPNVPDPMDPH